jgi:lipoprotein-anchoring transpeptidase ErfK/SrfK
MSSRSYRKFGAGLYGNGAFRMTKFVLAAAAALAVWMTPAMALATTLLARVDIATQTMSVYHHGRLIHEWPVSTARSGYITPLGDYRPYRIHRMWHSRTYDNAPMPFAVFYDRGWAVHGTTAVNRLGSPASHGCVRLQTANAEIFYNLVRRIGAGNTRIIVEDNPPQQTASVEYLGE